MRQQELVEMSLLAYIKLNVNDGTHKTSVRCRDDERDIVPM